MENRRYVTRSVTRSRNVKLQSGGETPRLPEEIIMKEILPRLPVKSLLKFKCVAKPWCSFIESKKFIKAHLQNSIGGSSFAQNCVFFDEFELEIKQFSVLSLFDKPFTKLITCNVADLGIDLDSNFAYESGCCYGLVCILEQDYNNFILWNPTTKEFRCLPSFYDEIQVEYGNIVAHGFGFDELDDDYKVFGMFNQVDADNAPIRCIGMIYSLKSNSWKVIEERDVCPSYEVSKGTYVSGKLHWYRREGYKRDIVSFDMNSHVYGVVELPSYADGGLYSVGVVGGCLSAQFLHSNSDIDVWLMKEYGVKESWDKVATIPYLSHIGDIPTALAMGSKGEVLLHYVSTIMIYDPKSDVFRTPQIIGIDEGICTVSLGIHIESLASVDPDTEQER